MKTKSLTHFFSHPFFWLALVMISYSAIHFVKYEKIKTVVDSDGRGYYAFLPSFFIYGSNGGNIKNLEVEQSYFTQKLDQIYLVRDKNGQSFNRYFPGVAILQAPFFGLGCLFSWLFNYPVDGYSWMFIFWFYVGSLFYSVLGMLLFARCLNKIFDLSELKVSILTFLLYIGTPLLFFTINVYSFSHSYSFFLFGLFTLQILKIKSNLTWTRMLFFGIIVGLIILVRPTNVTVLLMIPALFIDYKEFFSFLQNVFSNKIKFVLPGLIGLLCVLFILFLVWKWQTGRWLLWSYSGEGFNLLSPQFFNFLFSYRLGVLLHTPLLILSVLGLIYIFKVDKWKASFIFIYLFVTIWIMSSWWCWDYESTFGYRPFTEHLFFVVFPLVIFIKRFFYFSIVPFLIFTSIVFIRYWEKTTGFFVNQRFTKENYFESLRFWDESNFGRWSFERPCVPFGKLINTSVLLNETIEKKVNSTDEFIYTVVKDLHLPRTNERFFCKIELDKKYITPKTDGVMVVVDVFNEKQLDQRYYYAREMTADKKEETNKWINFKLEIQPTDNFQVFDRVKIYIWNTSKKEFYIRNVKITLEEYKR